MKLQQTSNISQVVSLAGMFVQESGIRMRTALMYDLLREAEYKAADASVNKFCNHESIRIGFDEIKNLFVWKYLNILDNGSSLILGNIWRNTNYHVAVTIAQYRNTASDSLMRE